MVIRKNFFPERAIRHWTELPGRWWSHFLGVFKESLDLTQCHGLDHKVMMGHRLDSISEVFSNQVDSVIPCKTKRSSEEDMEEGKMKVN